MYAVIQLGSKQYTVKRGDVVDIDLLPDGGEEGIEFTDVIFLRNGEEVLIRTPTLSQYVVRGQLLETTYGDKIQSVKYWTLAFWQSSCTGLFQSRYSETLAPVHPTGQAAIPIS